MSLLLTAGSSELTSLVLSFKPLKLPRNSDTNFYFPPLGFDVDDADDNNYDQVDD